MEFLIIFKVIGPFMGVGIRELPEKRDRAGLSPKVISSLQHCLAAKEGSECEGGSRYNMESLRLWVVAVEQNYIQLLGIGLMISSFSCQRIWVSNCDDLRKHWRVYRWRLQSDYKTLLLTYTTLRGSFRTVNILPSNSFLSFDFLELLLFAS